MWGSNLTESVILTNLTKFILCVKMEFCFFLLSEQDAKEMQNKKYLK